MTSGSAPDEMAPVPPPAGRGLTRRGVLRGGGAVAFVGLSAAALKLPFFGVDGARIDAADCAGKVISATDKKLVVSNWPAYIDPRRTKTAEGKIALAEAQALADVRAAAADAAVTAASTILSQSVKGSVADDLAAKGINEVRAKLN